MMTVKRLPGFVVPLLIVVAMLFGPAVKASGPSQVVNICQGSYAVLSAATTGAAGYQWFLNGQSISGATSSKYTAGKAGIYTVVAYNQNSCESAVSDGIEVDITTSEYVTFNTLTAKTVGDLPFQLNATSSNTNSKITYTASPSGIVSITNNVVTILAAGTVTITATADGKNSCGNAITATQNLTVNPVGVKVITAVSPKVDLAVIATSETKEVTTEQPFEYTLAVKNISKSTATNISVTDTLPESLSFVAVSSTIEGKADFDPQTRLLTWKMDTVKASAYHELRFSAKAVKHGTIKNTAKVASSEEDSNLANNTSTDYKDVAGISIPNVFTPNGDGKNDAFVIPDIANYNENQLIILNRWGSAVYQSKNYQNNWTGDKLDEGTYFYSLRVKNTKGEQEEYKGYVTLLRSNI